MCRLFESGQGHFKFPPYGPSVSTTYMVVEGKLTISPFKLFYALFSPKHVTNLDRRNIAVRNLLRICDKNQKRSLGRLKTYRSGV
jgi:hypothetical protein